MKQIKVIQQYNIIIQNNLCIEGQGIDDDRSSITLGLEDMERLLKEEEERKRLDRLRQLQDRLKRSVQMRKYLPPKPKPKQSPKSIII